MTAITDEHLATVKEHGYVLIPDFLSADEVAAGVAGFHEQFPTVEEYEKDPEKHTRLMIPQRFPFQSDVLNRRYLDHRLIDAAKRLIGVDDVLLVQAIAWIKYGAQTTEDQELHIDYHNNDLVVPRNDGGFRQIASMLYYTDVTIDHGPTYIVDNHDRGEMQWWPPFRKKEDSAELYAKEKPVVVKAGTLMLYSMTTVHRGSRFNLPSGIRLTQHICWRAAGYEWMGSDNWPVRGGMPQWNAFVESLDLEQRNALGFPKPGHAYWNEDTISRTQLRYPTMDMRPYREALAN